MFRCPCVGFRGAVIASASRNRFGTRPFKVVDLACALRSEKLSNADIGMLWNVVG